MYLEKRRTMDFLMDFFVDLVSLFGKNRSKCILYEKAHVFSPNGSYKQRLSNAVQLICDTGAWFDLSSLAEWEQIFCPISI